MSKLQKKGSKWDADKIRALRTHLNLTQNEMAEQLGTRQQTISEWEVGLYKPRGASATLLSMVAEQAKFEYRGEQSGDSQSRSG